MQKQIHTHGSYGTAGCKLAARLAVLQTPAQRATPLDLICLVGKLQGMFLHRKARYPTSLPKRTISARRIREKNCELRLVGQHVHLRNPKK